MIFKKENITSLENGVAPDNSLICDGLVCVCVRGSVPLLETGDEIVYSRLPDSVITLMTTMTRVSNTLQTKTSIDVVSTSQKIFIILYALLYSSVKTS